MFSVCRMNKNGLSRVQKDNGTILYDTEIEAQIACAVQMENRFKHIPEEFKVLIWR